MSLKTIKLTPAGTIGCNYLDMVLCLCLLGLLNMIFLATVLKAFPCTFLLYWYDAIVSQPYSTLGNVAISKSVLQTTGNHRGLFGTL